MIWSRAKECPACATWIQPNRSIIADESRWSLILRSWPGRAEFFMVSYRRLSSLCYLSFLAALSICEAQNDDVLCREGNGRFDAEFQREVRVHVGATKNGGLATRTCAATLNAGGQDVAVASDAWEIDLDVFGSDLGLGVPVAAFQVKNTEAECCARYLIYSLQNPPRLLRTVIGGSSIQASDIDLDTRVEVWTDDAAAVDGFDGLSPSELTSPPPVVLRFEQGKLLDVGAEFQPHFDQLITEVKGDIDPHDLKNFKNSDGKPTPGTALPPELGYRLRKVKIGVVEIVWAYLNSGREHEAWAVLADMWPGADLERARAAIVKARERGVHAQADGADAPAHKKKRATIYDVTMSEGDEAQVTSPQPILLRRPPPASEGLEKAEISVELIIDSAGKVVSPEAGTRLMPP
jgi:hypothetical protein